MRLTTPEGGGRRLLLGGALAPPGGAHHQSPRVPPSLSLSKRLTGFVWDLGTWKLLVLTAYFQVGAGCDGAVLACPAAAEPVRSSGHP